MRRAETETTGQRSGGTTQIRHMVFLLPSQRHQPRHTTNKAWPLDTAQTRWMDVPATLELLAQLVLEDVLAQNADGGVEAKVLLVIPHARVAAGGEK